MPFDSAWALVQPGRSGQPDRLGDRCQRDASTPACVADELPRSALRDIIQLTTDYTDYTDGSRGETGGAGLVFLSVKSV